MFTDIPYKDPGFVVGQLITNSFSVQYNPGLMKFVVGKTHFNVISLMANGLCNIVKAVNF